MEFDGPGTGFPVVGEASDSPVDGLNDHRFRDDGFRDDAFWD